MEDITNHIQSDFKMPENPLWKHHRILGETSSSTSSVQESPRDVRKRESLSSTSSSSSTHDLVKDTLKDVVTLQHKAMEKMKENAERTKLNYVLKATYDEMVRDHEFERREHEKTRILLQKEREKLEFALGEIQILGENLDKEKREHREVVKTIKAKSNRESQRGDLLFSKVTEKERIIQQQQEEIILKDNEICNLRERLKKQKSTHKQMIDDMELQRVQEQYFSRGGL